MVDTLLWGAEYLPANPNEKDKKDEEEINVSNIITTATSGGGSSIGVFVNFFKGLVPSRTVMGIRPIKS